MAKGGHIMLSKWSQYNGSLVYNHNTAAHICIGEKTIFDFWCLEINAFYSTIKLHSKSYYINLDIGDSSYKLQMLNTELKSIYQYLHFQVLFYKTVL